MPEAPNPKPRPHPNRTRSAPDDKPDDARNHTADSSIAYAELHITSNFTFLTGGSHPDEMVARAHELGHRAVAITDCNTLAGIVRAHVAAKEAGIQLVVGCRLQLTEPAGLPVLVYPTDRASYGRLCRLLTLGKRRAEKGQCHLSLHDLIEHSDGLIAATVPPKSLDESFIEVMRGLKSVFNHDRLSLVARRQYAQDDAQRLMQLSMLSEHIRVPLVATNDVHYHTPERRPLQDVLTCIRHGCTIEQAGFRLLANAERHLKPPDEMSRLFAKYPRAIERTIEIAARTVGFNLDQLRYEYPDEIVPSGTTPMSHLIELTWQGAAKRYPSGVPDKVRNQITHELKLIDELNYASYFLTVHDLVAFAVSRGILCQGRGAAANSAVCYCLGVTAVDPDRITMLFERFISKERDEPPDIDIDFEHERREEVIQYIYKKYGRDRAALTAEVISYRGRSAIREVGKAMGLSLDCVDRLAKELDWWNDQPGHPGRMRELGMNPQDENLARVVSLSREIIGFPRHLSQHVGGFVITRSPLSELVPIENAAMQDRTVIEWDKDDIEAMGMLKVDCLGLGMLTCLQKAMDLVNQATKRRSDEATKGQIQQKERWNDDGANVQGSDCMAKGNGFGTSGLCNHITDAGFRAVWLDQSDEARRRISAFEHCRRTWTSEHSGLHQASAICARIAGRIGHTTRTRNNLDNDSGGCRDQQPPSRGGSNSSSTHSRIGEQAQNYYSLVAAPYPSSFSGSFPPSLRRSVASSLSPPSPLTLFTLPPEDPAVYDMICRADTVGVFQIESRAQMSMLPRLRPRCYYDLVIEVAIVRPGPIQGKMVHPYLRRRNGEEPVHFVSPEIEKVLGRTLGVPLFQEQAMALAVVAAGFTPGEADQLRRAMAAWKRSGKAILRFEKKLIEGMLARGHTREFAEQVFQQISGFSGYGFPESHAASFALLVYSSAWLKCHHPAAFAAALINSQPMGFYQPAQIIRDVQEHGVEVRPVDVNHSEWDCTLEESDGATKRQSDEEKQHQNSDDNAFISSSSPLCCPVPPQCPPSVASSLRRSVAFSSPPLRLGMRLVKSLPESDARKIMRAIEEQGAFADIESLWRATGIRVASLRALAEADAFTSMNLSRQQALWAIHALRDEDAPLFDEPTQSRAQSIRTENPPNLPSIPTEAQVASDYRSVGLSLKAHPISFLREALAAQGVIPNASLADESNYPNGKRVRVAGIVLVRQRPSTASGIVFMTIEDETGIANLIVRPKIFDRFRKAARHSTSILCFGKVERQGQVVHVMAHRIIGIDAKEPVPSMSRDFH